MARNFTSLFCIFLLFSSQAFSQKYFLASAGESIFSIGTVSSGSEDIRPVLRWSPVFNFQEQLHFNFSNSFGLYTGLGLRNVGLISKVDYVFADNPGGPLEKTATIKERSYSFGMPLLFKLGDMDEGVYFAAGAEAEVMFAYKRKIMEDGTKLKKSRWFDDNVNIFNPSLMAEVHFPKGQYLRFKYYIKDFLNYQGITLIDGTVLPDYGAESPLFYIAFGTLSFKKRVDKKPDSTTTETAFFRAE
ncbi:MAG TPA: hypothetical protein PLD84_12755 [Chitinophagales bacterium]|nr:hypothetical protein [Chitinophagales bacterium]